MCHAGFVWGERHKKPPMRSDGQRQWRNVGEGQKGGEDRRERDDVRMQGVKDGIQRTEKEGFEEKHWEGQRNVINGVFVMVKTDIENRRIKERDGFMNRLDCWECWARKKENILKTIGWIRCDIFWFVYVGENQRKKEGKKERKFYFEDFFALFNDNLIHVINNFHYDNAKEKSFFTYNVKMHYILILKYIMVVFAF